MIELQNVTKTFNKNIHALNNVSLKVEDGEIFGIVGYSGAGKSTLIRLINGLEEPDEGKVIVDGVDIFSLSNKELRKARMGISMIFQNFNLLWSRTVKQNIKFPLEIAQEKNSEERAKELLTLVGLEDKENSYPSELSGGQKQRVGIARSLALSPKILLSDEATSALDPKTTDDILALLKEINHKYGITIVLITHQMEVVQKICTKMVVMSEGKIIEQGDVKEIFKNPSHELTKQLIRNKDNDEDQIILLKKTYPNSNLCELTFDEYSAAEPILANMAIETKITYNIVQASLKQMNNSTLGMMHVVVEKDIDKFMAYLEKKGVKCEIL